MLYEAGIHTDNLARINFMRDVRVSVWGDKKDIEAIEKQLRG